MSTIVVIVTGRRMAPQRCLCPNLRINEYVRLHGEARLRLQVK